jgi:A/G-specific adenine glycosylase
MDLGAMVCHSDQPDCETCPIGDLCRAAPKFLSGSARKPRAPARERRHEGKRHPDRIYRGRILALVRENGSMRVDTIGKKIDERFDSSRDASWLERMIDRLVQDRLLVRRTKNILLPD